MSQREKNMNLDDLSDISSDSDLDTEEDSKPKPSSKPKPKPKKPKKETKEEKKEKEKPAKSKKKKQVNNILNSSIGMLMLQMLCFVGFCTAHPCTISNLACNLNELI